MNARKPPPLTPQEAALIIVRTIAWTFSPDPYMLLLSLLGRLFFAILLFHIIFG